MIRIAAAADIHLGIGEVGRYRPALESLAGCADLFLLAGDLTTHGDVEEGAVCAKELGNLGVPTIAVLGNHDYHSDQQRRIEGMLEDVGVRVLEGDTEVVQVGDLRVGVAGTKGFGGGFAGACGSDFGEQEMKAFVAHTAELSARFEAALESLDTDVRIAMTHYSPVRDTLNGEPLEIYPFLGSYLLAEAIDRAGADLAFHGHAHRGAEKGITPQGTPVRNVAVAVINHAYNLYTLGAHEDIGDSPYAVPLGARHARN